MKQKPKILYIDDEEMNLKTFEMTFKNEYNIITSFSGENALEKLKNIGEVPVIVTDQRMVGMSGIDLLEVIRCMYPNTIRILLTAYTEKNDFFEAINTGKVYSYIIKPWKKEEVKKVLDDSIEKYSLVKENAKLFAELTIKNRELELQNEKLNKVLDDLTKTQKQLLNQEKKAVVGSLAAGLVHEIRNQLSPLSFLELVEGDLSPKVKEYIKYIFDGRSRILNIIDEVKSLAKDESVQYQFSRYELNDIINESILLSKMDSENKRKNIIFEPDFNGYVLVNKNKIIQVLINLINNAIHAIENTENGRVLIKTIKVNDHVVIKIIDNGLGINRTLLNKIWKPFFYY